MFYQLLADTVVVLHGAFVLFVLFGGALVMRNVRWGLLHVPAVLWAAYVEITGGLCPLTPLEDHLRSLAGQSPLPGDFIERCVTALLYPDGLSRTVQTWFGIGAVAVNIPLYLQVWRRLRRG